MWAGVQNVSRPIVMCQEMSHSRPTMMLVDPASIAVRYQGTAAALSTRGRGAAAAWATDSIGVSLNGPIVIRRGRNRRFQGWVVRGDGGLYPFTAFLMNSPTSCFSF